MLHWHSSTRPEPFADQASGRTRHPVIALDVRMDPYTVTTPARALWTRYERIHAVTYFSEEAAAAATAAGYRGFWMGYVAQRAAPLGPVGPVVVAACFYGFHPSRIERALPDAWTYAPPPAALDARLSGVDGTLRRLWGDEVLGGAHVAEAADLLWEAAQAADTAGRVLGAANQALPRPDAPHLALWQATTALREHRGDGHVAALVAAGVGPLEASLLKIAAGEADEASLRHGRAWPDEDWAHARRQLLTRGWLDASGELSDEGVRGRRGIEAHTDAAAAAPWAALGPRRTARAIELLDPLVREIVAADEVPVRNPIGLPLPDDGGGGATSRP